MDFDKPYIDRIIELVETRPISLEQIVNLIEVAAHYSDYGVFDCDRLLFGLYGGDVFDLTEDKLTDKLECAERVKFFYNAWRRVVLDKPDELYPKVSI